MTAELKVEVTIRAGDKALKFDMPVFAESRRGTFKTVQPGADSKIIAPFSKLYFPVKELVAALKAAK